MWYRIVEECMVQDSGGPGASACYRILAEAEYLMIENLKM